MISSVELSRLISYLKNGNGLYIEGNDFFRDHQDSGLFDHLGCAYVEDGDSWFRGKISTLQGQRRGITSKFSFKFLDRIEPNASPDIIEATEGRVIFASQDGKGRAVSYANRVEGYNVIVSSFAFGGLLDGKRSNTKKELMKRYLKFLISGK